MLQKEELKRYSRQIILPELGLKGQEKLKSAKVLMIGAGGLGCPVLQYLAAAGVGQIGIIDDDVVAETNLHRQILYGHEDIGFKKADLAAQKLRKLNPFIAIQSFTERLNAENAPSILKNYDLIIDGSDNFPTRYLVNDTCVALNKTLVFGSIFKFEGQVSVFNYENGPQYRDIFPESPPEDEVPNCAEIGVIGVLPGIIGTFMANEAIKVITEIGEVLSGKLLTFNALDASVQVFQFKSSSAQIKNVTAKIASSTEEKAIDISDLKLQLQNEPTTICLVDVREEYEFEDFNIGGINIPLYELVERIKEIPLGKTLVFCCQSSQRSKLALKLINPHYKGEILYLKDGVLA
ncbi:molybdopterin/thiamine biosynthesis adenylyltransferase/rhodanese-related sulfurtransferase [Pedobacter sp. UYP30]|uniref:HesA/MoeB/ThiF family protein n=1 Tax=Pedobacter sp. UYP30 TaxID=1756400 RepID=UPI0033998C59